MFEASPITLEMGMTLRSRFEGALDEWNRSVNQLNDALVNFMNDGLQTDGGTWILTMNQTKSDTLHAARRREDVARAALQRIIDDVRRLEDGQFVNQPATGRGNAGRPALYSVEPLRSSETKM